MSLSVCLHTKCTALQTHRRTQSVCPQLGAPPAPLLQRHGSPACLNGRQESSLEEGRIMSVDKSELRFQAVLSGGRGGARVGRGKKIKCKHPFQLVSSGQQGPVWERERNGKLPEFSWRKWHFLPRERELFHLSPTLLQPLPFPASPCMPLASPVLLLRGDASPPNFPPLSSLA